MEHGKKNRKFGRTTKPRKALLRSLANALMAKGKIQTTEAKAKSLRPYIEKLLTIGKKAISAGRTLTTVRLLNSEIGPKATQKLMKEILPKVSANHGGYTRIIKLTPRVSDGAKMAIIELIY